MYMSKYFNMEVCERTNHVKQEFVNVRHQEVDLSRPEF